MRDVDADVVCVYWFNVANTKTALVAITQQKNQDKKHLEVFTPSVKRVSVIWLLKILASFSLSPSSSTFSSSSSSSAASCCYILECSCLVLVFLSVSSITYTPSHPSSFLYMFTLELHKRLFLVNWQKEDLLNSDKKTVNHLELITQIFIINIIFSILNDITIQTLNRFSAKFTTCQIRKRIDFGNRNRISSAKVTPITDVGESGVSEIKLK
ncbi:hypothetical protein FF38_02882 [Lucilia cuprina]|uniref:Uncharacterized protein n=1 Tax=Lucilia cuprina TaxID=7375 RepID=A0A0L0BS83_LUCCU|nr:hypothetical protein FF38_02882 [Lucilia cuprina]